jgi:hypothetical protein
MENRPLKAGLRLRRPRDGSASAGGECRSVAAVANAAALLRVANAEALLRV